MSFFFIVKITIRFTKEPTIRELDKTMLPIAIPNPPSITSKEARIDGTEKTKIANKVSTIVGINLFE